MAFIKTKYLRVSTVEIRSKNTPYLNGFSLVDSRCALDVCTCHGSLSIHHYMMYMYLELSIIQYDAKPGRAFIIKKCQ